MRLDIKHYGRIVNGRKEYYNPDLYREQLSSLNGKEFVEVIKEVHKRPSTDQHAYYRAAILITCHKSEMFSHFDKKDDIHDDYFAPRFLGYMKLVTVNGKTFEQEKVRSLADLTKDEMTEFITRVKMHCETELNIFIPEPHEYYQKYYQR